MVYAKISSDSWCFVDDNKKQQRRHNRRSWPTPDTVGNSNLVTKTTEIYFLVRWIGDWQAEPALNSSNILRGMLWDATLLFWPTHLE